jgi:hypothetical protein
MYQSQKLVNLLQMIEDISFAPMPSCTVSMGLDYYEALNWAKRLVWMLANLDKIEVKINNQKLRSWITIASAAYRLCSVIGDKIVALHSQGLFTDEQLADFEDAIDAAYEEQHDANIHATTILFNGKIT